LNDMRQALEHFQKHPVASAMTGEEASGFRH